MRTFVIKVTAWLLVAIISTEESRAQRVDHLVISQVYGGGGNLMAPFTRDFIEIFNPTGTMVNLNGWSVQYASATGTSWTVTNLTGSIAAGKYYLVAQASGGTNGSALPTPDASGTTNMAASTGKIALVNSTIQLSGSCPSSSTIVDLVGYGSGTNCSETTVASGPGNSTTSLLRITHGCTDKNNNSTDFSVGDVNPRNSSSPAVYCYATTLAIATPSDQTAKTPFSVTVSLQDAGGNPKPVTAPTDIILTANGANISGTTSGTIAAGATSVTITGVILTESTGVTLTATVSAGEDLKAATSNAFVVINAAAPALYAEPMAAFGSVCVNATTGPNGFTLSGSNLTGADVVIGELPGFIYATTPDAEFSSSLTLPAFSGNSTTIYVKFKPTSVQNYSGAIPISGGGAPLAVGVTVSGAGVNNIPEVAGGAVSSVTAIAATITGTIIQAGCTAVTAFGVEYSVVNGFANGSGTKLSGTNLVDNRFHVNLTALQANTTYYYKTFATNAGGTSYSGQLTFTTSGLSAPVTTAAANVTDKTFTANWSTVEGAEGYRLDIASSAAFTSSLFHVLVNWHFPGNPDDNIADLGGIAANATKTLTLTGFSGAIEYSSVNTPASTTSAASVAGWHTGGGAWQVELTTAGYYNVRVSSVQRSTASGPKFFTLQYKIGSSGNWKNVEGATVSLANDWSTGRLTNIVLPVDCDNQPSIFIRWLMTTTEAVNGSPVHHQGVSSIDEIKIEGNTGNFVLNYFNVPATGTSYFTAGLSPNTTYYYRVRAYSVNSTSGHSNTTAVTTDKSTQLITFDLLDAKTFGDAAFTLEASTNSLLPVSYTSSNENVATIEGNTVTIRSAGTAIITALQPGNDTYHAAKDVEQLLVVNKASPIITWSNPEDIVYGTALDATQLNASASVEGSFAYLPAALTLLSAGDKSLSVKFTPTDKERYEIVEKEVSVHVLQRPVTVAATALSKYCSQLEPTLHFKVKSGSLVTGDNFTGELLREPGESAGVYLIQHGTLTLNNNYTLSFVPADFTISGLSIDASASSTPVPLGSDATLTATISLPVAGIKVTFLLNGNKVGEVVTDAVGKAAFTIKGLAAGVYKVEAITGVVCGTSSVAYLPVYDPDGGFVTGGGWINSPAGSIRAGNSLGLTTTAQGVANFGFVARYKKGTSTVDGNTEFQFRDGNLNFRSTSHTASSLIIDKEKATYRGTGTINGTAGFKFTLIATDADVLGIAKADKFRIRIWDNNDNLLYDNNTAADSREEYSQGAVISGGSIVIHQPAKKSEVLHAVPSLAVLNITGSGFVVKAFPNPTSSHFALKVDGYNTADVILLQVFNQLGQVVEVRRNLFPGQTIQLGDTYKQGTYFLEVTQGKQKHVLQLVKTN